MMLSLEAFLVKMTIAYMQNHNSAPVDSQLAGWTELYKNYLGAAS
ncbi:hypothetical protein [Aliivibrio finisterrensis]|nr:hypothetical protein [Aliivibrio finisterrensis]